MAKTPKEPEAPVPGSPEYIRRIQESRRRIKEETGIEVEGFLDAADGGWPNGRPAPPGEELFPK